MGSDPHSDRDGAARPPSPPVESWAALTLFVTDTTPSSTRARRQLHAWLAKAGTEDVSLEVVDVLEHPEAAEAERVLATPALVRHRPLPRRKIVGDLGDWERVSMALDLEGRKP